MTKPPVTLHDRDGVAVLTIDRPERRNAIDSTVTVALNELISELGGRQEIRAIILTGGGQGFCAGSDLVEMAGASDGERLSIEQAKGDLLRTMARCPKPILAAVEAFALGGGLMLAVACDIVVAAENARLGLPEVRNGFFPPWGLHWLAGRVGEAAARRLCLGYEPSAHAAAQMKLVDVVAPAGETVAVAMDQALALAQLPAGAVASTKRYFEEAAQSRVCDDFARTLFAADLASEAAQATFHRFRRNPDR